MTTVELTRFRTRPGTASDLLAARPGMLQSFRNDRAGFIRADLVRLGDDEWLDVVVWASAADRAASAEKGANTPEIGAFFAPISELVSAEDGELVS